MFPHSDSQTFASFPDIPHWTLVEFKAFPSWFPETVLYVFRYVDYNGNYRARATSLVWHAVDRAISKVVKRYSWVVVG